MDISIVARRRGKLVSPQGKSAVRIQKIMKLEITNPGNAYLPKLKKRKPKSPIHSERGGKSTSARIGEFLPEKDMEKAPHF